jgi:hypothetical protein
MTVPIVRFVIVLELRERGKSGHMFLVRQLTIISGGQSGVDRAALGVAVERGLPYAGWCPKDGWAEDLAEPPGLLKHYPLLKETPLADPAQRTEWNVRGSDAVLAIVSAGGLQASRGTALARALAERYGKPLLVIDPAQDDAIERTAAWLRTLPEELKLGIGGPRESEAPGIYALAGSFLRAVLSRRMRARTLQDRLDR